MVSCLMGDSTALASAIVRCCPNVTVAQNIYAGREAEFSKFGILNFKKMEEFANKCLAHFGITHIKASDIINRYNFEDRKLVEIVRCVDNNTEILVVDETTTALSHDGRKILYDLIHRMAEQERIKQLSLYRMTWTKYSSIAQC